MTRILIVEDDPRLAKTMDSLLSAESHTTVVVHSGEEGIERLRSERFNLLLTDLLMEKGTGFDVLEWARTNAPDLPVLICSSYARPELLKPHLEGLRHRIVKKPFEDKHLTSMVAELLLEDGERRPGPS